MTLIIKKRNSGVLPPINYRNLGAKSRKKVRTQVLDCLFREFTFVTPTYKIRALSNKEFYLIASRTGFPITIVKSIINKFLVWLVYFRKFLKNYKLTFDYNKHLKKLRIQLFKIHRIAPVFDYKRAKVNARILKSKLDTLCFWPQFMTQIAIIIYVTDLNDKNSEKKIVQNNLRVLCDCSAYAFHRTRNRLRI
ncbi:MAG: hypothetical protein ACW99L_16600 [Promethearchaeota archaeon]|jgi:hypothetical protein